MKKILLMCLALIGCHSNEAIFKDVSTITLIKQGKQLQRIDIESSNHLVDILNQVTVVNKKKINREQGEGANPDEKITNFLWDYKLLITKKGTENIWLYSSETGYLTILSKQRKPLYKLMKFNDFNEILQLNQ